MDKFVSGLFEPLPAYILLPAVSMLRRLPCCTYTKPTLIQIEVSPQPINAYKRGSKGGFIMMMNHDEPAS
jgi:hypothetical protein